MKGYSIENKQWQELVNESQLLSFAEKDNTKDAIKSLTKKGFKVESVNIYSYEERYNKGE